MALGQRPADVTQSEWGPEAFRAVAGHFASGVTVITTRHESKAYGTTASAVTSLSLEPPMMLVCLNRTSSTREAVIASGRLAVNILGEDQADLARRFARKAADKFDAVPVTSSETGLPLLDGAVAHLECVIVDEVAGGTHSVFLAEVVAGTATAAPPLAYFRGRFGSIELDGTAVRPLSEESLRQGLTAQAAIEMGVVALTIDAAGEDALVALTELNERVRPTKTTSVTHWMGAYNAFHTALVELAGSPELVRAHARANAHIMIARVLEPDGARTVAGHLDNMQRTYDEHAALLRAYHGGDRDAALTLIRAHHDRVLAEVIARPRDQVLTG